MLEGGSEEEEVIPPNAASLVITEREATVESLKADLNDMWESEWDWKINQARKNCFSVVYPSAAALRMSKKSGTFSLSISEHKAEVGEPLVGPQATSWLQETWIRVFGIPDKLRQEPLIKEILRAVGKAVMVDEKFLNMVGEPVRAKILCRKREKIKGTFEIFRGTGGFVMRIEREVDALLAPQSKAPLPPPPPPHDEDADPKDSYRSLTSGEWDAAGGSRPAGNGPRAKPARLRVVIGIWWLVCSRLWAPLPLRCRDPGGVAALAALLLSARGDGGGSIWKQHVSVPADARYARFGGA